MGHINIPHMGSAHSLLSPHLNVHTVAVAFDAVERTVMIAHLTSSLMWWCVRSISRSFFNLHSFSGWIGYFGGMLLTIFLLSLDFGAT